MTPRSRRVVVLLAAVVAALATSQLGFWQLRRAAQKEALQQAQDSRRQGAELHNGDLAPTLAAAEPQLYRPVRLKGRWVPGATVYLDNRQMDGRPGFFVLTPLRLEGRGQAIVVQRGWAPRNMNDRTAVPKLPEPAGDIEVQGWLAPPPGRLYDFGSAGGGSIRQNLDIEAFGREVGLDLLPTSVLADDGPGMSGDDLARHWPAPDLNIERHYGYAFQWFGLCALLIGLYAWFQVVQPLLAQSRGRAKPHARVNPETQLSQSHGGDS